MTGRVENVPLPPSLTHFGHQGHTRAVNAAFLAAPFFVLYAAHQRRRSLLHEFAFSAVARERRGALEFRACLVEPSKLLQEITAHRWQKMIVPERTVLHQSFGDLDTGLGSQPYAHRHGAVQFA